VDVEDVIVFRLPFGHASSISIGSRIVNMVQDEA